MQEYPIKRGLTKDIDALVAVELKKNFELEPVKTENGYTISFGAIKRLDIMIGEKGKSIIVDTESDISAPDEVIIDSNKRFRKFLDAATGFSTKERVKRAKTPAP
ncbi:MAG: hypothetical protein STSR0009_31140 [Methanoregula sp.]